MAGGAGNDTYFVDNAGDVVNEAVGQGTDTVMASVNYALTAGSEIEFLRANAGATGLSLTGNALANRLVGGAGNDTLDGGAGNDSLGGGAGNDIFRFLAGFGQDTITDFTAHAGAAGSKDLLDISGLGITAATFAASVKIAAGGGGSTMVSFGGGTNSIRLLNVGPGEHRHDRFQARLRSGCFRHQPAGNPLTTPPRSGSASVPPAPRPARRSAPPPRAWRFPASHASPARPAPPRPARGRAAASIPAIRRGRAAPP